MEASRLPAMRWEEKRVYRAARIRTLTESVQGGMLEIGHEFAEARKECPYGEWEDWVRSCTDYEPRTVNQFIQVWERFGGKRLTDGISMSGMVKMLSLPAGDEEAFIAQKDPQKMSVREIERAAKDWKKPETTFGQEAENAYQAHAAMERDEIITQQRKEISKKDDELQAMKADVEVLRGQYEEIFNLFTEKDKENTRLKKELADSEALMAALDEEHRRSQTAELDEMSQRIRAEETEERPLSAEELGKRVAGFILGNARMATIHPRSREERHAFDLALRPLEEWIGRGRAAAGITEAEASIA